MTKSIMSVLLTLTMVLSSCGNKESDIKIGVYLSLTGSMDSFGASANNGFKMALDEINAAGGILGKKVTFVTVDDQSKSSMALSAVKDLIQKDKVVAILGEVVSSRSLAAAPACQDAGIPMVTPSSTHPEVTRIGDYIFRTCFIDPFQSEVMADFAINTLKIKSICSLMDLKNEYSMNLGQVFDDKFSRLGGKILSTEFYSEGDVDFTNQIKTIKAAAPQAIFIPGYFSEVSMFAIQARKAGIKAMFLGTDGWDSPRLLETAGRQLEGSYFSNHFSPNVGSASVDKFVADYLALYNVTPDAMAVLAYDAARTLFDAIKRAGIAKPEKIKEALAQTVAFPGVVGPITIDPERNAVKPAVILKISHSQFEYVDTVAP